MTHPWTLHATAACWSLHTARHHLAAAVQAADAAADDDADRGTLQAWRPGSGSHGGHSDPLAAAVVGRIAGGNPYRRLATSTEDTLRWLAEQLHTPAGPAPLARLTAAIPALLPGTCAALTRWLREADERIRLVLGMPPDHWRLPGAPACPCCGIRMLRAQTSAPDTAAWTVVCTAGCVCAGEGCGCGMPVRVEGVGHIWGAGSDLVAGAVAGAAQAQAAERTAA